MDWSLRKRLDNTCNWSSTLYSLKVMSTAWLTYKWSTKRLHPECKNFFQQHRDGNFRYLWWAQDLFHDHVIAVNHPIEWPPRSPDLTPCDFLLWGHLKNKVFENLPHDIRDLRERIQRETYIRQHQNPEFVRRAANDMRRRCTLRLERGSGHLKSVGPWEFEKNIKSGKNHCEMFYLRIKNLWKSS